MLASLKNKSNANNERSQNYTLEDGAELDSFPVVQISTAIQWGEFFAQLAGPRKSLILSRLLNNGIRVLIAQVAPTKPSYQKKVPLIVLHSVNPPKPVTRVWSFHANKTNIHLLSHHCYAFSVQVCCLIPAVSPLNSNGVHKILAIHDNTT